MSLLVSTLQFENPCLIMCHACTGTKAHINGKTIAIFKYMNNLYAIVDACPHQGGPLHMGDIEDIDGAVCVSCPRHHWSFSLRDGTCRIGVDTYEAECYPVQSRKRSNGDQVIFVGFPAFSTGLFNDTDF